MLSKERESVKGSCPRQENPEEQDVSSCIKKTSEGMAGNTGIETCDVSAHQTDEESNNALGVIENLQSDNQQEAKAPFVFLSPDIEAKG